MSPFHRWEYRGLEKGRDLPKDTQLGGTPYSDPGLPASPLLLRIVEGHKSTDFTSPSLSCVIYETGSTAMPAYGVGYGEIGPCESPLRRQV